MKRLFAAFLLSSVFNAVVAGQAADAVTIAAQQEAEERMKRLAATLEEVQTAQASLQRQFSALASEVGKLRDEVARNNNNAATQEALKRLSDQIVKVDESRIAGDKVLQEALKDLGKTITSMPPVQARPRANDSPVSPTPSTAGTTSRSNANAAPFVGYEYVVQSGDNHLGVIVKRYHDEGKMVSKQAIMAANPDVNWTKLRIGQKILIPQPK